MAAEPGGHVLLANSEVLLADGWVLVNVHSQETCRGQGCAIHHASPHHMRNWTLQWRADRRMLERLCPSHGTGHPDPDGVRHVLGLAMRPGGGGAERVRSELEHGCCGCCTAAYRDIEADLARAEATPSSLDSVTPSTARDIANVDGPLDQVAEVWDAAFGDDGEPSRGVSGDDPARDLDISFTESAMDSLRALASQAVLLAFSQNLSAGLVAGLRVSTAIKRARGEGGARRTLQEWSIRQGIFTVWNPGCDGDNLSDPAWAFKESTGGYRDVITGDWMIAMRDDGRLRWTGPVALDSKVAGYRHGYPTSMPLRDWLMIFTADGYRRRRPGTWGFLLRKEAGGQAPPEGDRGMVTNG